MEAPHSAMLAEKETKRILGVAFEFVCAGLRTGDCDDDVKEAIAKKIIQLANGGERNPDLLCERVLKDIRTPRALSTRKPHLRSG